MKKKPCKRCGLSKPLSEFHRNKATKDGRLGTCKVCFKERATLAQLDPAEPETMTCPRCATGQLEARVLMMSGLTAFECECGYREVFDPRAHPNRRVA